jgi:hypothetical protein
MMNGEQCHQIQHGKVFQIVDKLYSLPTIHKKISDPIYVGLFVYVGHES